MGYECFSLGVTLITIILNILKNHKIKTNHSQ